MTSNPKFLGAKGKMSKEKDFIRTKGPFQAKNTSFNFDERNIRLGFYEKNMIPSDRIMHQVVNL